MSQKKLWEEMPFQQWHLLSARGSDITERMWDALCQLKSCQVLHNYEKSHLQTLTTSECP